MMPKSIVCAALLAANAHWSESAAQPPAGQLLIAVVDRDSGTPVHGSRLSLRHDFADERASTDDQGICPIELPAEPIAFLDILVEAPGFATMRQLWQRHDGQLSLPPRFTFELPRGRPTGGTVVDPDGKPVAGASVRLTTFTRGMPRVFIHDHALTTDADGRWQCDITPPDMEVLVVSLRHPDFVGTSGNHRATSDLPLDDFYRMTAVLHLQQGEAVSGRVLAGAGAPVSGATVCAGPYREGSTQPVALTGADGRFRFHVPPGSDDLALMVHAEHLAPRMVRVERGQLAEPLDVRLEPGGVVRGRVVDHSGRPIHGAEVAVERWGGGSFPWSTRTDAEGRFEWDGAPVDEVILGITKGGYVEKRGLTVRPRQQEYAIELHEELLIRGSVIDASSGEPIPSFTVTPGFDNGPNGPVVWAEYLAAEGAAGRYSIAFDQPQGVYLLVEAQGHLPVKSRLFRDDEGTVAFDCALATGSGPSARVVGRDGQPVGGAEVHLTRWYSETSDGRFGPDTLVTTTDADGRFTLPPQVDRFALIVVHDQGHALLSGRQLEQSDTITLLPWGRVEGTYLIGDRPLAQRQVELAMFTPRYGQAPKFVFRYYTMTDEQGRFAFEGVPAGLGEVASRLEQRRIGPQQVQRAVFDARSGETLVIQLGGRGRAVVGRVVPPADSDPTLTWTYGYCALSTPRVDPPFPEEWPRLTDEEQSAWYKSWGDTKEARAFMEQEFRQMREYHFEIQADGGFRIADVEPGRYELSVVIHDADELVGQMFAKPLAVLEIPVTVSAADAAAEPFSLGALSLTPYARIELGAEAPDFEAQTVDGQPFKLSDHRGRYVLLDFWATWCGPCREEMTWLKKVHSMFGDERLRIIGLSLDAGPAAPRAYARKNDLGWTQGHLGAWEHTEVPGRYGVWGIPSILLIDPQGHVVAKDLHGDQIVDAVTAALRPGPGGSE